MGILKWCIRNVKWKKQNLKKYPQIHSKKLLRSLEVVFAFVEKELLLKEMETAVER